MKICRITRSHDSFNELQATATLARVSTSLTIDIKVWCHANMLSTGRWELECASRSSCPSVKQKKKWDPYPALRRESCRKPEARSMEQLIPHELHCEDDTRLRLALSSRNAGECDPFCWSVILAAAREVCTDTGNQTVHQLRMSFTKVICQEWMSRKSSSEITQATVLQQWNKYIIDCCPKQRSSPTPNPSAHQSWNLIPTKCRECARR